MTERERMAGHWRLGPKCQGEEFPKRECGRGEGAGRAWQGDGQGCGYARGGL